MRRSLSSCLDATRMWRRTERVSLEKKPSTRLSQEPCLSPHAPMRRQRIEKRFDDLVANVRTRENSSLGQWRLFVSVLRELVDAFAMKIGHLGERWWISARFH